MKLEEWLVSLGLFTVVILVVVTLLPEKLWTPDNIRANSNNTAVQAGVWPAPSQVANPGDNNAVTIPAAAIGPTNRTTKPQPGLMAFEQAPRVRFNGPIQQISEMPGKDGQIHVWLDNLQGQEQHLSIAPGWFLEYMGCTLTHDATISGVGFQFDHTQQKGAVIYVKKLVIGKTVCHLRNDEGFALWSNRLR